LLFFVDGKLIEEKDDLSVILKDGNVIECYPQRLFSKKHHSRDIYKAFGIKSSEIFDKCLFQKILNILLEKEPNTDALDMIALDYIDTKVAFQDYEHKMSFLLSLVIRSYPGWSWEKFNDQKFILFSKERRIFFVADYEAKANDIANLAFDFLREKQDNYPDEKYFLGVATDMYDWRWVCYIPKKKKMND